MLSTPICLWLCLAIVAILVSAGDENKYFHEPAKDDLHRHYDTRFFQDIVSDEERQLTLTALIRAYLLLFNKFQLETWIGECFSSYLNVDTEADLAHGTLLGWFWNGKILPWVGILLQRS